jgi:hypothetical protein
MRITTAGNVGIGTTSPTARLQVKGSGATSGTTTLRVENSNASSSLVVLDNGFVGINKSNPTQVLEVVGNTIVSGSIIQRGSGINLFDVSGFGGGRIYGSYGYANGEIVILPSASNPSNFIFSPTNGMSIGGFTIGGTAGSPPAYGLAVSGSIGIGTRVPITQLDVSGSGRFTGNLTVTGSVIATSFTGSLQGTASYAVQALSASWAPGGTPFPYTGSAQITGSLTVTGSLIVSGSSTLVNVGPAIFSGSITQTASTASFAGLVGIGTTTPTLPLDVNGGSAINVARFYNASSVFTGVEIGDSGNSFYSNLIFTSNSSYGSIFKYGTFLTSWAGASSLNIYNENGAIGLHPTVANAVYLSTAGNTILGSTTDAGYKLDVQGTGRFINSVYLATTSGNVGIRTTSPIYTLDVSGSINTNTGLTVTGSFIVNDGTADLIDTTNYVLNDSSNSYSRQNRYSSSATVNWLDRALYDPSVVASIDWGNRQLIASNGGAVLLWDTPNQQQAVEVFRSYFKSTPDIAAQENFSNAVFNAEGRIITGVSFSGSADYDFVYLDTSGEWRPVDNVSNRATKMLGIAFDVGGSNSVLLEGHVTITDTPGTYQIPAVDVIDHGLPIYVSSSAYATTVTPSATGEYVRILGHAYYQNTGDPDVWIMNFRPDHTWVEL